MPTTLGIPAPFSKMGMGIKIKLMEITHASIYTVCPTKFFNTTDLKFKKICQQNPPENLNLFLATGNITDQSQIKIEPIIVWTLDGAAIKISRNWNFELKFFLVIALVEKIGSTWF